MTNDKTKEHRRDEDKSGQEGPFEQPRANPQGPQEQKDSQLREANTGSQERTVQSQRDQGKHGQNEHNKGPRQEHGKSEHNPEKPKVGTAKG